jgi:hypothetical protein
MAESPAHRFGQVIGELLESVVRPQLEQFCHRQGLYLDHQKKVRKARRGRKVSWEDHYSNSHDLDFVIERDGTDQELGQPVAFIEVAWRRYTKYNGPRDLDSQTGKNKVLTNHAQTLQCHLQSRCDQRADERRKDDQPTGRRTGCRVPLGRDPAERMEEDRPTGTAGTVQSRRPRRRAGQSTRATSQ